jgi:hypothetical protein
MLTIEQRIHRLDRRISIFEQTLNLQCAILKSKGVSIDMHTTLAKKCDLLIEAQKIRVNVALLVVQPIPKFPKGGYIKSVGEEQFMRS